MRYFEKILLSALLFSSVGARSQELRFIPADTAAVEFIGRVERTLESAVKFDWTGTCFRTVFDGSRLAMRISDTGQNYFNVFVNDSLSRVVKSFGSNVSVELFTGTPGVKRRIRVQKRTEGEQGIVVLHGFLANGRLETDSVRPRRHIEFIGNSLTCGYGSEGKSREEPFRPETENCDISYACVIARCFDADYTLIAHSGHGAARNYGESRSTSACTMRERMLRTLDTDSARIWEFTEYTPDLVVVNLGSNDFSTTPHPSQKEFSDAYRAILLQLRNHYGPQTVILCVTPRIGPPAEAYIAKICSEMNDENLYHAGSLYRTYNNTTDMGASWHPNSSGHRKMALALIPYIATIMNWEIPDRVLK